MPGRVPGEAARRPGHWGGWGWICAFAAVAMLHGGVLWALGLPPAAEKVQPPVLIAQLVAPDVPLPSPPAASPESPPPQPPPEPPPPAQHEPLSQVPVPPAPPPPRPAPTHHPVRPRPPTPSTAASPDASSPASPAPVASSPAESQGGPVASQQAPARISCAIPRYPERSRELGETGTVLLALSIDTEGRVADSRVEKSSGFPRLDEAALAALSKCRFRPGTVNDTPQASWVKLRYVWKLD